MALWSEITSRSLAEDVWLQARRAAGDPAECRRRLAKADAELPAWRQAVRRQMRAMRDGGSGPIELGILWHHYRAAQHRARIWRTTLQRAEESG